MNIHHQRHQTRTRIRRIYQTHLQLRNVRHRQMSRMTTPQKFHRRSRMSRTKKILQYRRQDQSHRQGIQGNQRRTKSRLESKIRFLDSKKTNGRYYFKQ